MARAASGLWTAKSVSALAAFAAVFASSAATSTARAQAPAEPAPAVPGQPAPAPGEPAPPGQPGQPGQPATNQPNQPAPGQPVDPAAQPAQPAPAEPPPAAPPASGAPGAGNTGPGAGGATLTLGGGANGAVAPGQANQPQKDQPGAEKKKQGMTIYDRLAGSSLFIQTGATIGTLFKGYQPNSANNPTVATYAVFSPRFALSKDWQLRGRLGGNFEYTNSDVTTYRNELELTDTTVQLFYRGIPALGGKVKLMPFVSVIAPTSKASRARTMIFTPTIGVQAAMPIEHFLGGEALALASFNYGRPIYNQTTPTGLDERPYQFNCAGGNECGGQLSGTMNARDTFSTILIFAATWWKLSPGTLMLLSNQIAYSPKATGLPTLPGVQEPTSARASSYFALWLDAEVADWVTPEIGYQQQRSLRAGDGGFGNPFFSNKQDQVLYIGANFQLDSLLKKVVGEEGKAGVVRAHTKPAPNPIRFY